MNCMKTVKAGRVVVLQEAIGLIMSPNASPSLVDLAGIVLLFRQVKAIRQDTDVSPALIVGFGACTSPALATRMRRCSRSRL